MEGVSDHGSCKRATWTPSVVAELPSPPTAESKRLLLIGKWQCFHCDEVLALGLGRRHDAHVDVRLARTAKDVDGLKAYALPDKYRTARARVPRRRSFDLPHHLPFAIYCPGCRRVQHLHDR